MKNASLFYRLVSFPSRTMRLLTRHRWLSGLSPTAVNSLATILAGPYVDPLDYHVWGIMLEHQKTFYPKPKNTDRLKKVLQLIWNQLPHSTGLNQQGHTELSTRKPSWRKGKRATAVRVWRPLAKKSTANQRYATSYWWLIVTVAALLTVCEIFSRLGAARKNS